MNLAEQSDIHQAITTSGKLAIKRQLSCIVYMQTKLLWYD